MINAMLPLRLFVTYLYYSYPFYSYPFKYPRALIFLLIQYLFEQTA
jgi:hypothetical protein